MSGVRLWDGSSWRAMVKPTADREMPSPVAHKVDTVRMVYATTGPSKQEQGRNQACGEEDMFGDWIGCGRGRAGGDTLQLETQQAMELGEQSERQAVGQAAAQLVRSGTGRQVGVVGCKSAADMTHDRRQRPTHAAARHGEQMDARCSSSSKQASRPAAGTARLREWAGERATGA